MPIPEYIRELRTRVGHDLLFVPGAMALTFNERNEVLLNRRTDTGRWATIGGAVEPGGESPAEAAVRETLEETGLLVAVERVSGVYTLPAMVYPNGDKVQSVIIAFRCRSVSGVPRPADDESSDVRYFPLDALPPDLPPAQHRPIMDAAKPGAGLPAAFGR
jgi:8-oxo-dGTP pyrophosphatase MutT (NUDIX family)